MPDNCLMKKILFIKLSVVLLSACQPPSGGGSSSGSGVSQIPIVSKSCESTLQRAWVNEVNNLVYEFHSSCIGYIPSCDAQFDYNIDEIDYSGGTISVSVTHSANVTGCPSVGDQAVCTFDYESVAGQRRGMYVKCGNGPVVYYRNSYGVP